MHGMGSCTGLLMLHGIITTWENERTYIYILLNSQQFTAVVSLILSVKRNLHVMHEIVFYWNKMHPTKFKLVAFLIWPTASALDQMD